MIDRRMKSKFFCQQYSQSNNQTIRYVMRMTRNIYIYLKMNTT
jgi:hypothetical protein